MRKVSRYAEKKRAKEFFIRLLTTAMNHTEPAEIMTPETKDIKRFRKGLVIQIIGIVILVAGLISCMVTFGLSWDPDNPYPVLLRLLNILSFIVTGYGIVVYNKGRRLRLHFADDVLAKGEPFVLYLRSFKSEPLTNQTPAPEYYVPILPPLQFLSEEEKLANALRVIGAGITVGKPGEKWPSLGFSRLYVTGDWMSTVESLMSRARLVIVRIADTDGVLRELEIARKVLDPKRLVLLVPKESDLIRSASEIDTGIQLLPYGPYGPRWELELSPGLTVPILKIPAYLKAKYSFLGIIYFDSDWAGHARLVSDLNINFTHALDKVFKPVYKQLGIRKGIRLYQVMLVLALIYAAGFTTLVMLYGGKQTTKSSHNSPVPIPTVDSTKFENRNPRR